MLDEDIRQADMGHVTEHGMKVFCVVSGVFIAFALFAVWCLL
jgi:hypothetical protein